MGKLILCNGVMTNRPYVFASTGIRIYSIEELCYYLNDYVYFIEEAMFTDSLIDWIGTELKLTERAAKLKQLKSHQADVKTMVTVVLCSSDYYTEQEIKELLRKLDKIIGMPPLKRNYIKANNFLKKNQYGEAAGEYESLLNAKEATELTPEEYGDILHNLAVAKIHISGLKEASDIFLQAYERNHKIESMRQYLVSLSLSNNIDLFCEKIKEYQVNKELCEEIETYVLQVKNEAQESEQMLEIQKLRTWKSEGRMNEYYKKTHEMIDLWKNGIRQG